LEGKRSGSEEDWVKVTPSSEKMAPIDLSEQKEEEKKE